MFISMNWIKDYVDLSGIDEDKLIQQFTLSCAEVEGVEHKGRDLSGVVTARIESIENHPNSKKLHLLKVNAGNEILNIVCGAPNVREGMIIPLAKMGAKIGDVEIDKAIVGGYESFGMCCSAKELGFSDDNSGLYEFSDNTPLGVDIKNILPIEDTIFEVDNKSLTNRPDMWGHYGIAREISALTGRPLKAMDLATVSNNLKKVDVKVETESCYRYTSCKMENITRKVSPMEMQIRLFYCGMRGINFLTDITNYIMLELGQPMHAFDNEIVDSISVEKLVNDTEFETLDETKRILPSGTMVIKSKGEPVAIAGVMGGLKSAISDSTKNVLIESACFDGVQVRRTAIKLGLRTEASARYEKMLDTNLTMKALLRYVYLVEKLDEGAKVSSGIADVVNFEYPKIEIEITKDYINRYIGQEISNERVVEILKSLEFGVTEKPNGVFKIDVPSHRATKDISGKADIVEEITRIYGYDNIKPSSTLQTVEPVKENIEVALEYAVKYALATRFNLSETHSYIWYDNEFDKSIGINPSSVIRVVNSIQKDSDQIRNTMIPTMLKVVNENKNDFSRVGVFEIGRVVKNLNEKGLTNETKSLCIALADRNKTQQELLVEMKNIVNYIFDFEIKSHVTFKMTDAKEDWFLPINHFTIISNKGEIGEIGALDYRVAKKLDGKLNVVMCEINFSKVLELDEEKEVVESISKYPKSEQDFNFNVPKNMLYSEIEKIGKSVDLDLEYRVSLLDIFEKDIEPTKSVTLHYDIWRYDRTLTGEELEKFHEQVISHFKDHNIELKLS